MDYNQEEGVYYKDYLIIIHPMLTQRIKNFIQLIGRQLHYDCILDFSNKYETILDRLRIRSGRNRVSLISRGEIKKNNKEIEEIIHEIKVILYADKRHFDEIYCRNMSSIEKLIVNTCIAGKQIYRIEDGIGDYAYKRTWKNRKRILVLQLKEIGGWLAKLILGCKPLYIKHMLPKKKKISGFFLNLNHGDHILIQNHFRISIKEEVEIYNKVLQIIKRKYKISEDEIWYKPHPRSTYEGWKYKKDHLRCRIYCFNNNSLFEMEITSSYLKAVYSVGSTSLLYAKAIFGLEAYLIDLRKYNIHPTAFDMYYDVCTRYGVKVVKV